MKIFESASDAFKIVASYFIGAAAIGFCLYAASRGPRPELQILLCIVGGTVGWCIGLYLTPSSDSEKKQLSEAAKVLATLLSGFGLGKASEIAKQLGEWLPPGEETSATRPLLFVSTLLIGALFTYISRLFVKGDPEDQKSRRAKSIQELRTTLDRLEKQNQ